MSSQHKPKIFKSLPLCSGWLLVSKHPLLKLWANQTNLHPCKGYFLFPLARANEVECAVLATLLDYGYLLFFSHFFFFYSFLVFSFCEETLSLFHCGGNRGLSLSFQECRHVAGFPPSTEHLNLILPKLLLWCKGALPAIQASGCQVE